LGSALCFLNTYRKDPVDAALHDAKDSRIISFSMEASWALRQGGVKYEYVDDFFPLKIHENLDALSNKMSQTWYKPFDDKLQYHGVDVGPLFMQYISYYFRDALKCFSIATQVLKKNKPEKVICSPPLTYGRWSTSITMPLYTHLPHAFASVCKMEGVPFESLSLQKNDQVFEKKRQERKMFDLAVKGRNLLKDLAAKGRLGGSRGRKMVLAVGLKPKLHEMLEQIASENGLDLINYLQASDILSLSRPGDIESFCDNAVTMWKALRKDGKDLPDIPEQMDPVKDILDVDFDYLFTEPLVQVLCEIDRMSKVLTKYHFDFVLVGEDLMPLSKARVATATNIGIPSGVIMHGFLPHTWHTRYAPPTATYNFVWGPGFIKTFTNENFPLDRIRVTGLTSADIIYSKPTGSEIRQVREKLGIPEDKKMVLWATQPLFSNVTSSSLKGFELEIIGLFKLMKERNETFVVKPHPIDPIENYQRIAQEVGCPAVITKGHLPVLLHICDALIADNSTVGLQAIAIAKPFILLRTRYIKDLCGYVDGKVATPVFDLEELPTILDKIMKGGPASLPKEGLVKSFLDEYATGRDGSSLNKLVEEIKDILKKKDEKDR